MLIKKNAIYNITIILLILILFFDSNCFYLFNFPEVFGKLISFDNKYLIIILELPIVFILSMKSKQYFLKKMFWYKYAFLLLAFSFILSIYSMFKYDQDLVDVFTVCHYFLLIFLVIPILYYFIKNEGIDKFMNICNILAVVMCILLIVQSILFDSGNIILKGIQNQPIQLRHGNIRLSVSNIVNLSIIYNMVKVFNGKDRITKKMFLIISLVIEIYTIITVQMTRVALIIFLGVLVCIILSKKKVKFKKYILLVLVLSLIVSYFDISSFINSFSLNSNSGTVLSTTTRIDAIKYYIKVFIENPVLGNGFIRSSRIDLFNLAHGPFGVYYYTDVGVVGIAGEQGILGILLYLYFIFFIINTWYKINKIKRYVNDIDYGFINGIIVYCILSSFTLVIVNSTRFIMIPIIISIFEFYKIKYGFYKI